MTFKQKKNVYLCDDCGLGIITQDLDEGVTPFMVSCAHCKGVMTSLFYKIPQEILAKKAPAFVWRKPTLEEEAQLSQPHLDHVRKGGLLKFPHSGAASKDRP